VTKISSRKKKRGGARNGSGLISRGQENSQRKQGQAKDRDLNRGRREYVFTWSVPRGKDGVERGSLANILVENLSKEKNRGYGDTAEWRIEDSERGTFYEKSAHRHESAKRNDTEAPQRDTKRGGVGGGDIASMKNEGKDRT